MGLGSYLLLPFYFLSLVAVSLASLETHYKFQPESVAQLAFRKKQGFGHYMFPAWKAKHKLKKPIPIEKKPAFNKPIYTPPLAYQKPIPKEPVYKKPDSYESEPGLKKPKIGITPIKEKPIFVPEPNYSYPEQNSFQDYEFPVDTPPPPTPVYSPPPPPPSRHNSPDFIPAPEHFD